MYEDKFLENTETDEYNGILKNARIVVPLKWEITRNTIK